MTGTELDDIAAADKTRLVTRGVCRLLTQMDQACVTELRLKTGRRVDVISLDSKGKFTIVEVKVSVADFRGDRKWQEYLPFCDAFYFAVPMDFPQEILPEEAGLITADAYGAAILNPATEGDMNGSRRKALTIRFARHAASRLGAVTDEVLGAAGKEFLTDI